MIELNLISQVQNTNALKGRLRNVLNRVFFVSDIHESSPKLCKAKMPAKRKSLKNKN